MSTPNSPTHVNLKRIRVKLEWVRTPRHEQAALPPSILSAPLCSRMHTPPPMVVHIRSKDTGFCLPRVDWRPDVSNPHAAGKIQSKQCCWPARARASLLSCCCCCEQGSGFQKLYRRSSKRASEHNWFTVVASTTQVTSTCTQHFIRTMSLFYESFHPTGNTDDQASEHLSTTGSR